MQYFSILSRFGSRYSSGVIVAPASAVQSCVSCLGEIFMCTKGIAYNILSKDYNMNDPLV